ncbi:unnamed protein product [Rotaria sp. Silwood1]|nr:unnamed protein product [Rotaria sp. Silwood1]
MDNEFTRINIKSINQRFEQDESLVRIYGSVQIDDNDRVAIQRDSTRISYIRVGGPDQRRLLKYLLTDNGYNPIERPVQNDSHTLSVIINLALQHIIDFDGKNEAIVISGWMTMMWNDYSLKWKPEEFGNIETLRIPSTQIWTPDILLYNSADEKFDPTMKVNAVVQHNGDILYVPPVLFKSICSFDIAGFPFVRINLTAESSKGQLDAYVKSAEWDLEVPCFLISCMTLLGFLLAPDSGEKLTLQVTILLTVVMFSLLLSEIMPPSSNAIPIITIYFMCIMIMSAVSVVASVIVISLHFRNSKNYTMPLWVRKYICNYLAWLLFMKRPNHDLSWRAIRRQWAFLKQEPNNIKALIGNNHSKIPSEPLLHKTFELLPNNIIDIEKESLEFQENQQKQRSDVLLEFSVPRVTKIHRNVSKELHTCDMEMVRSELRIIISQLTVLTNHFRRQEEHDDETQDWKFIAMVIDRLCLIIFSIVMFVFTTLTFLNV